MTPRPAEPDDPWKGLLWSMWAVFMAAAFLIPYRYAVEGAPRFTAMTAMFVSAGVFNAGVAAVYTKRWGFDAVALKAAVVLATFTFIGNLGIAQSLPTIGAGMTSVVLKSQVVLTPVIAYWALSERLSGRFWAGAVLALAGVALPAVVEQQGFVASLGYGWAFVAAVGFAGMQIVTRRVIDRIEPAAVNALRLFLVVAVMQSSAEGRAVWSAPASVWLAAGLAGLLGPGLSRLALMTAVRYVSPSFTALVALVGPIFAFGLGAVFFSEAPTTTDLLGAGLVLAGVLWTLLPTLAASRRIPAAER